MCKFQRPSRLSFNYDDSPRENGVCMRLVYFGVQWFFYVRIYQMYQTHKYTFRSLSENRHMQTTAYSDAGICKLTEVHRTATSTTPDFSICKCRYLSYLTPITLRHAYNIYMFLPLLLHITRDNFTPNQTTEFLTKCFSTYCNTNLYVSATVFITQGNM